MSPTSGYRAATEERAVREPGGKGRLQEWFRCSHFQSREESLMEQSSEPDNLMPRLALRFAAGMVGLSRLAEWMAARGGMWTGLLWEWRPQQQSLDAPASSCLNGTTSGLRISSHANVVSPRGQRGGLPIVEEGVIEGGCGVSGAATAEESEVCTRAGIAALNSASTEQALGAYPQVKGRPGTFQTSLFQA